MPTSSWIVFICLHANVFFIWMLEFLLGRLFLYLRFDCRGYLVDVSEHDSENIARLPLTQTAEDKALEDLCNHERYIELHNDIHEVATLLGKSWEILMNGLWVARFLSPFTPEADYAFGSAMFHFNS